MNLPHRRKLGSALIVAPLVAAIVIQLATGALFDLRMTNERLIGEDHGTTWFGGWSATSYEGEAELEVDWLVVTPLALGGLAGLMCFVPELKRWRKPPVLAR